ncbi:TIGR03936 family radical SAM-associated protein [Peptostreptococcus canis]|uniref:DUF2344 domain-containing protein n=1 Tax=Peptostreptococcus canis TaxID=1159213 RepID=A0ABR6TLP7_9FIRM|nr:TIGR03936 family radical SAM-associated protein [Peptostreptococcus canis]MBC2576078.1 DUF2344 domain-containing protein [Peptostreptococcus canis]MBP1997796.1 radical SAM-linked protein [Peptostreptococcus canis]
MSKVMRIKFTKYGDMIYISHLDVQRLFQRVFRRAGIELTFSQGFNPHPKMSYGNALALGIESFGEYVDIEIEDDISPDELIKRINSELPDGMEFVKCIQLQGGEKSLAANIEYGKYEFIIPNINKNDFEFINGKISEIINMDEILVSKKNKKGKIVELNIRPLIIDLNVIGVDSDNLRIGGMLATGSKQNLNTNVFIPKLLEFLNLKIDHLDVDIKRNDLYFYIEGKFESPM